MRRLFSVILFSSFLNILILSSFSPVALGVERDLTDRRHPLNGAPKNFAAEERARPPLGFFSYIHEILAPNIRPSQSPKKGSLLAAALPPRGCDGQENYGNHQYVQERFFRRLTRNPVARRAIAQLKTEIEERTRLTPVPLDRFSSRTRILLMREITALCGESQRSIPFLFKGEVFMIHLDPSLRQPGSGIVSGIGKYRDICRILGRATIQEQQEIARKLKAARSAKPYHPAIPDPLFKVAGEILDLERLNLLLDFEIARRLQGMGEEEEKSFFAKHLGDTGATIYRSAFSDFCSHLRRNERAHARRERARRPGKLHYAQRDKREYDEVPVASAIGGGLRLASSPHPIPFTTFFHAPYEDRRGGSIFPYGQHNVFEGIPARRKEGTRRIIQEQRQRAPRSGASKEAIHQDYLRDFGGGSESEGEDYDEED